MKKGVKLCRECEYEKVNSQEYPCKYCIPLPSSRNRTRFWRKEKEEE